MSHYIKLLVKLFLFAVWGLARQAHALPEECIQSPERTQACPHQIYKKAAVAVASINVNKGAVVCLCLTDLKDISDPDKSKLADIDRQVTLQRVAQKYRISEQDLANLLKY